LYRNGISVDGLKTGHTDAGGYGLTASGIRDGRRLILVLNGMSSMQERADESSRMLDWGFREFGLYPVVAAGDQLGQARVWLGRAQSVPLLAAGGLAVTLPRSARDDLKATVTISQPVPAPIVKGQQIGMLTVSAPGMDAKQIPLVAANDVQRLDLFHRMIAKLRYLIHRT